MEFNITPEALATAVSLNIQKQKERTLTEILKTLETKLGSHLTALANGEYVSTPNEFAIYLPPELISNKIDEDAAQEAAAILKDKGFRVTYTMTRGDDPYSDDHYKYIFKV